ncbi:GIY-YIG nuclease family protein [Zhouia spongiae]|uniref:GIY-YIG nuclease family protein n=1 Tax=Zhouia spongiae TaxID=2202721 RepID=A0ABY3YL23_9FLAO|nr:exonuclease domain-containing protein [Zhouia spongiae]UNY98494.1 GIY-YIG nuclease family protein [Zhouia spongiae]
MYAIVDIETTGFGGQDNRITEIAVVVYNGIVIVREYHTLVNPEMDVSRYVTGLTGIDNDMLAGAPTFNQIADIIDEITTDHIFVAHSVNFDYNVIKNEYKRIGRSYSRKRLCTVRLSRQIFPGFRSYSLGNLCRQLDIPVKDRHRAKGDADATVKLFEKLLLNDSKNSITKHLNARSKELTLPPLLPKKSVENLPNSPGIYYFFDAERKIIYVGKAVDIKKRVFGHFYDKKAKELALTKETAFVEYEETGSELLALLMEASEIKRHYPKYNTAQKRRSKGYGITIYTDRKGIKHIVYNTVSNISHPIKTFHSVIECIAFLEYVCSVYKLCPKYTQLQKKAVHCSHFKIDTCEGICRGNESITEYNKKVHQAVKNITSERKDFVIMEKGRTPDENGIVLVEDNHYIGHGFLSEEETITRLCDFKNYIKPVVADRDFDRIIDAYLLKNDNARLFF